jgi:hypothetical protein
MRRWKALAVALGLALAGAVLYTVPPAEGTIYPRCLFHLVTGLHCPACGSTRCLHALLHGRLLQAAAYNLLCLFCVPVAAFWGLRKGLAALTGRPAPTFTPSTRLVQGFLFLLLLFGVLRNLNFAPFNWLAPHEL